MKEEAPIPVFHRGLDIPEYQIEFIKHLPQRTILYDKFWFDDQRDEIPVVADFPFYRMQETAYYGSPPDTFSLPGVTQILDSHGSFVVELDAPIRPPELATSHVCNKGVVVRRGDDGLIEVATLLIGHPTNIPSGGGVSAGWFYRLDGDVWTRAKHVQECPCNNDLVHERNFHLLRILDEAISDGRFQVSGLKSYVHTDLLQSTT